jgi:hypothetical protein
MQAFGSAKNEKPKQYKWLIKIKPQSALIISYSSGENYKSL